MSGERDGSFATWYLEAWPRLAATMSAFVGDRVSGEDLAAHALALAYERWDTLVDPFAWTYRVAVNAARRRARRQVLERRSSERWGSAAAELPDVEPELWAAVGGLPPRQRMAIVLRYVAGLSQSEVAAAMGVAPGTAATTLHAARTRLRAVLRATASTEEVGR